MASLQGHVLLIGSVPCKLTTLTVDVRFNHWNRNRTNYRIKETPWLRKTKPFWKATRDWVIKIEWIWLETFQIKSLTAINTCARKFMHIALRDLWSFVSPEKKLPLLLLLQISLKLVLSRSWCVEKLTVIQLPWQPGLEDLLAFTSKSFRI